MELKRVGMWSCAIRGQSRDEQKSVRRLASFLPSTTTLNVLRWKRSPLSPERSGPDGRRLGVPTQPSRGRRARHRARAVDHRTRSGGTASPTSSPRGGRARLAAHRHLRGRRPARRRRWSRCRASLRATERRPHPARSGASWSPSPGANIGRVGRSAPRASICRASRPKEAHAQDEPGPPQSTRASRARRRVVDRRLMQGAKSLLRELLVARIVVIGHG